MKRSFLTRAVVVVAVSASMACVVRLNDKFEPVENGGVGGAPVDCSKVTPAGTGAPGGPAEPLFVGRFDRTTDPAKAIFDWSGNYIEARFNGASLTVKLEAGNPVYFVAALDDRDPVKFKVVPGKTAYQPIANIPAGDHTIRIQRLTEALSGAETAFLGFDFGGGKILPQWVRPRRIEYIGDSITCGYGNEGANATCPYDIPDPDVPGKRIPETENQYLAFGAVAARNLQADAVTVCWSGKGVYQNYREKEDDPDKKTTVPQYYLRTIGGAAQSVFDFKDPEPGVVVISLGTNDFARDLNQDSIADGIDLAVFKAKYAEFVKFVRSKRPNAHIFLAVPPMLSDKFPLDNARRDCRAVIDSIAADFAAANDPKVYGMELLEMGVAYGLGCDYHPNIRVHGEMARQVQGAIRSKTCW